MKRKLEEDSEDLQLNLKRKKVEVLKSAKLLLRKNHNGVKMLPSFQKTNIDFALSGQI